MARLSQMNRELGMSTSKRARRFCASALQDGDRIFFKSV
jgi:hypothetical protein